MVSHRSSAEPSPLEAVQVRCSSEMRLSEGLSSERFMKKAVITTGGKQYLVHEGEQLEVELLGEEKTTDFSPLLVIDGDAVKVGKPTVEGAKVTAKVIE